MPEKYDVIVIGGGAAGMTCAIMLKRQNPQCSVLVLEKQSRVGRKLLATGNGTCNLSNEGIYDGHYHSSVAGFPDVALAAFPPKQAMMFFESVGVPCEIRENGRIYPFCQSAAAVLDCLRLEMHARNVQVATDQTAVSVQGKQGQMIVKTQDLEYTCQYVVLATGGCASPSVGGSMDGYALLSDMGHTRTKLFPSIVQIQTDSQFVKAVKGLRIDALCTVKDSSETLAQQYGEVLFTEYGLSGPAIMQISRPVGEWELKKQGELTLTIDLLPLKQEDTVWEELSQRQSRFGDYLLEDYLTGMFQRRIGQTILRVSGVLPLSRSVSSLSPHELKKIASTIKEWSFTVKGTQGFKGAQVTAGGLCVDSFDPYSLQSKKCSQVFAIGEVLDVDGDCGGYNLHWAWASACLAASSIGRGIQK